ncbi:hypothetical protein ACLQ2R_30160 [Streptosporangium sp. DT93]|uniref:hypothetical protein n=1 Tax=Streptosporangium sp. DT93 TaxID=3393428 RepID=UPI003CE794F8
MLTKSARSLIVAAAMTGGLFTAFSGAAGADASAPVQPAASGGGCYDHTRTDPCISLSGNFLYADFYQNSTPDSSMSRAVLTIVNKGKNVKSATYQLTRTGRFGPISYNKATLPVTSGSAYARVDVYTSSGALHYSVKSPVQYY